MLVCHCRAINDRRIRGLIEAGARDEFDIAAACGAGAECGGCLPAVHRLLDECLACPLRPAEAAHTGTVLIDVESGVAVG